MKVYYAFKLKSEFINLYKDNPSVLFNILKSIYYLDRTEVDYGYNLFKQLILPINKNYLDRHLYVRLHKDIPYLKRDNIHCINNLYKDEVSRLIINNFYIKLELDQDFSSFFETHMPQAKMPAFRYPQNSHDIGQKLPIGVSI